MNQSMRKILTTLASRVKTSDVVVPIGVESHKITDDNQAIPSGVIYEKSTADGLRGENRPKKRGRPKQSKR